MKKKDYQVYEIKTKKSGGFGFAVVICGLLLTISVCNLFGYAFFSSGISLVSGKGRNTNNFYAVEVNCFDNYDDALKYMKTISSTDSKTVAIIGERKNND